MGRHTGSGTAAPNTAGAPLYVRVLRLKHVHLGGLTSFVLFEASSGLTVFVALAGYASWWAVLAVPLSVAAMVKLNDAVAGHLEALVAPPAPRRRGAAPPPVTGRATVSSFPARAPRPAAPSGRAPTLPAGQCAVSRSARTAPPVGSSPQSAGRSRNVPQARRGARSAAAWRAHDTDELTLDTTGEELVMFFAQMRQREHGGGPTAALGETGQQRDGAPVRQTGARSSRRGRADRHRRAR